jgi:hypothetical protein
MNMAWRWPQLRNDYNTIKEQGGVFGDAAEWMVGGPETLLSKLGMGVFKGISTVLRVGEHLEKGKYFRGGAKAARDLWYGFNDPEFQRWWHREGKEQHGDGQDLPSRQTTQAMYELWKKLGKPRR